MPEAHPRPFQTHISSEEIARQRIPPRRTGAAGQSDRSRRDESAPAIGRRTRMQPRRFQLGQHQPIESVAAPTRDHAPAGNTGRMNRLPTPTFREDGLTIPCCPRLTPGNISQIARLRQRVVLNINQAGLLPSPLSYWLSRKLLFALRFRATPTGSRSLPNAF